MKRMKYAAYAAAAMLCLAMTGCSSGAQESTAPRVEIAKIQDEVIEPNTEGADIQVLNLENPIDYSYSSSNTDMTFDYKDGVWLDGMDASIPINQEKLQAMADNFLKLHAVSSLEMPENLDEAFGGVKAAVEEGRLSEERIDGSVLRILRAKQGLS